MAEDDRRPKWLTARPRPLYPVCLQDSSGLGPLDPPLWGSVREQVLLNHRIIGRRNCFADSHRMNECIMDSLAEIKILKSSDDIIVQRTGLQEMHQLLIKKRLRFLGEVLF